MPAKKNTNLLTQAVENKAAVGPPINQALRSKRIKIINIGDKAIATRRFRLPLEYEDSLFFYLDITKPLQALALKFQALPIVTVPAATKPKIKLQVFDRHSNILLDSQILTIKQAQLNGLPFWHKVAFKPALSFIDQIRLELSQKHGEIGLLFNEVAEKNELHNNTAIHINSQPVDAFAGWQPSMSLDVVNKLIEPELQMILTDALCKT